MAVVVGDGVPGAAAGDEGDGVVGGDAEDLVHVGGVGGDVVGLGDLVRDRGAVAEDGIDHVAELDAAQAGEDGGLAGVVVHVAGEDGVAADAGVVGEVVPADAPGGIRDGGRARARLEADTGDGGGDADAGQREQQLSGTPRADRLRGDRPVLRARGGKGGGGL